MPCTLQPWEIELEERAANKRSFKRSLTDSQLLEEIACSACRTLQRQRKLNKAPLIVQKWWRLHQEEDAARKGGRR
jgi:hypothetical protein